MAERTELATECEWQICLFGGLTILRNGKPVDAPPYRTHSLLAALLLHPRPVSRVYLCGLLFPDYSEQYGRKRISDQLWLLRKALPNLPLVTADGCVHLHIGAHWLDVTAFRDACRSLDPADWWKAIELYQGDLLPDNYDEWLLVERENLLIIYTSLSNRLVDWCFENQDYRGAIPCLERLVQIEPLDEDAVYKLMQAQARIGNRGASLSVHDRFLSLCEQEGMQPNPLVESYAANLRLTYPPANLESLRMQGDVEGGSLLEAAQRALERGDRWSVEAYQNQIKRKPNAYEPLQVSLLEIDLALEFGDHAAARELIRELDPQASQVKLRAAKLASESQDPAIISEMAADILEQAQHQSDERMIMEALLILGRAQMRLGEMSQGIMSTEKVINLGRKHVSPYHVLSAQILQGRILMRQGHLERALAMLEGAYQLANQAGYSVQAAAALHYVVNIHYLAGSILEALECSRRELEIWRDLGAPAQEAAALQMLATLECQFGRHTDAIRSLEDAQQILDQLGDRIRAARNLYHLASTIPYQDESDLARAISLGEQALQIFQECQQAGWQAAAMQTLGYCLWLQDKHTEALEKFETAYEMHDRLGEMSILPEIMAYQALALLGLGRQDEALQRSRQALLQLTGLTLENDLVSEIYYAHAEVLASLGDKAGANRYYSRAYQNLLIYAQPIKAEQARRAFFERDPTMRRLMRQVYARGIARPPEAGVVERRLQPRLSFRPSPVEVQLTLDAGPADQALKQAQGAIALRRAKLERIWREAQLQSAAPTVQEMADLLGVSDRTVKRDLAVLRQAGIH